METRLKQIKDILSMPTNSNCFKRFAKKLAKEMVPIIRRHIEFCAIGGIKPFQQYYVCLKKNNKLVPWNPDRHGYFFDTIITTKDGKKILNPLE